MTNPPKLLAIGGALIDRRGQSDGKFAPGVSNPGSMREEIGGAAFNTARMAALRGTDVAMMTARGGDIAGQAVADAIKRSGLRDLSSVHLDRSTPSYTAILDQDGELQAAIADMGLYDVAFAKLARRSTTRQAADNSDAVLIDANLPEPAIVTLLDHCRPVPVYANAISPAKAVRLKSAMPELECIFMNASEAAAIAGAQTGDAALIDALRALGASKCCITRGSKAILFFDEADAWTLQPPLVQIADVTGAGDALAGATLAALMQGHPLAKAVRQGAAAAALTAGSHEVSPEFSDDIFTEMLKTVPEPKPI